MKFDNDSAASKAYSAFANLGLDFVIFRYIFRMRVISPVIPQVVKSPVYNGNQNQDNRMGTQRFENFIASGIYLLMGISTSYMFSVGLANGIASGYHYPVQQKLLIGAALTGASALMLSAIVVHFRPAAAYGIATVASLLLWLAFWPLVAIINQGGPHDVFAVMLLSVATIFSVLRLLKLVRS